MITVRVKLYGTLRRFSNTTIRGVWEGQVESEATFRDLLHAIGTTEREVAVVTAAGRRVLLDALVETSPYDIKIVTPVGGG